MMGGPPPMMLGSGRMMFRRNLGSGVTIAQGADGQTELWSPEELVMESSLNARLPGARTPTPLRQAAVETARKVKGKWTCYLAFRKSIMGVGFAGHGPGRPGIDPLQRGPNERFARLTPEQRVQQTRERRGVNPNAESSKN